MITDLTHENLHYAAQHVCLALTKEEYDKLSKKARVTLAQLAMYAGCTHVDWWPEWAEQAKQHAPRINWPE